jgi:hypothetical protein
MKSIIFIIATVFASVKVHTQSKYEVHAGLMYSNINLISFGDQGVFPAPYGRPNYFVGYRLGIHKKLYQFKKLDLKFGLSYERKGANQWVQQIAPFDSLYDARLDYIQLPVTASIKLLDSKTLHFIVGLTPGYLIGINKREKDDFALDVIVDPNVFNLDLNLGLSAGLYRGLSVQIEYQQGLTSIEKDYVNTSNYTVGTYHHTFCFSLKLRI